MTILRSALVFRLSLLAGGLALVPATRAIGQAVPAVIEHDTPDVQPVHGVNFSLDYTTQHNSSTGWANIITPDLSYRFTRHFSVSALVPAYLSLNAYVPTTVKAVTTYPLLSTKSVLGDTVIVGDYDLSHKEFTYSGTLSLGLPTGNSQFGLSANQVTYNVTNHFDYNIGPFDPEIEIGEGDSSSLTSMPVKKPYTAVGPMANFQVGTGVDLPFGVNLQLDAYENLPIGNQNVYGTITKKNKKGKTVTRQVLEGTGAAEDNGFIAELDIPVGTHVMVAGTYERSLIQGLDTASVGVTWTLRRPKIVRHVQ